MNRQNRIGPRSGMRRGEAGMSGPDRESGNDMAEFALLYVVAEKILAAQCGGFGIGLHFA